MKHLTCTRHSVLIYFMLLTFVLVGCGGSSSPPPVTPSTLAAPNAPAPVIPTADEKLPTNLPVVKMSIDDFAKGYHKDSEAFSTKLQGSVIEIEGPIDDIDADPFRPGWGRFPYQRRHPN